MFSPLCKIDDLTEMYYLPPSLILLALLAKDIANNYEERWQNQTKADSVYEIIRSFCSLKRETLHSSEIGFQILFVTSSDSFRSMVGLKRTAYLKNVMKSRYTIWHK